MRKITDRSLRPGEDEARDVYKRQVQNPDAERREYPAPRYPQAEREVTPEMGLKYLLDTQGPEAVSNFFYVLIF